MPEIKICGITREEDALLCADEGADFLGFIFAPKSRRGVTVDRARALAEALRGHRSRPKLVGVFVDETPSTVNDIALAVGLDLVQLHGDESDADCSAIRLPVIKAYRVGQSLPDTSRHASASWLLFDTLDMRQAGGTGRSFDWSLLESWRRDRPFFLSGGLTTDNIARAVSQVRPDGVDIASGVESSPGIKDHDKVRRLFERLRRS
jgi:phosphoribosylanthranilate isomerase